MSARASSLFSWPRIARKSIHLGPKTRSTMITTDSPKSPRNRVKTWGRVHFCHSVKNNNSTQSNTTSNPQWWTTSTNLIRDSAVKIEVWAIILGPVIRILIILIWQSKLHSSCQQQMSETTREWATRMLRWLPKVDLERDKAKMSPAAKISR